MSNSTNPLNNLISAFNQEAPNQNFIANVNAGNFTAILQRLDAWGPIELLDLADSTLNFAREDTQFIAPRIKFYSEIRRRAETARRAAETQCNSTLSPDTTKNVLSPILHLHAHAGPIYTPATPSPSPFTPPDRPPPSKIEGDKEFLRLTRERLLTYNDEIDAIYIRRFVERLQNYFTAAKFSTAQKLYCLETHLGPKHLVHYNTWKDDRLRSGRDVTWDSWLEWLPTRELFFEMRNYAETALQTASQHKDNSTIAEFFEKMTAINANIPDHPRKRDLFQRWVLNALEDDVSYEAKRKFDDICIATNSVEINDHLFYRILVKAEEAAINARKLYTRKTVSPVL